MPQLCKTGFGVQRAGGSCKMGIGSGSFAVAHPVVSYGIPRGSGSFAPRRAIGTRAAMPRPRASEARTPAARSTGTAASAWSALSV